MLYKGDFRSLDQSVDEKGQLYSVRIFTGYNPYDANSKTIGEDSSSTAVGPYPTKKITAYISGMSIVKKDVPDNAVQLTMCDHPFVVNYAGDPNNIHKPYRCSSATVSFLQENLNTDFVNSLGNGVMVMLLKWKNEVMEVGNHMANTETGEVLNKKTYSHYDDRYGEVHTYWTGYMPWEYDKFCYEIEWVGFATPEMLNVEYDNLFDRFTLNCQDALSTLQYTKFVRNEQVELMSSSLTRMLYTLGVYRDIYITNAVHMSGAENDTYSSTPIVGNPLQWIAHQEDNYINEDSENMKYLEVLEDMMEYLSLTAIPYKDQLWIVSAEGLAQGHTVYTHYQLLNNPPRLWTLPAELSILTEETGYSNVGEVDIVDTAFLTKDDFCGGTDLSSNVMYNKVKVVCDEMRINPLMPDLSSDDYFEPETAAMDQPMAVNLWDRYQQSGSWVEDHYHYFEMYANRVASGVEDIKFYKYYNILSGTPTPFNWGITPTDPMDADLMVTHHESYSGQSAENPIIDWLHGVVTPPSSGGEYYSNISMMVDMMDTSVNSRTEIPTSLNYTRYILLATPGNYVFNRKIEQSSYGAYDWDDKTTYWNPMLYMKSKPFFGNGKQYLNLTGDFIFNNNFYEGNVRYGWYPYNPGRTNNEFRFDANYNYIWVKVKCGKYWLTDNGRNSYSWTTTESFCRLWLDNAGLEQNADWRGKTFSFETTVRGVDGISIKLPINEGFGEPMQLEIWFDRPMGPAAQYDSTAAPEHNNSFLAQSTLIKDMNINIYSSEYIESRKRKNPDRDNTEYSNPIVDGAVEEMPEVNLIHSSCDTAGLSYSETALRTQRLSLLSIVTRYRTNPKIMSDGVGQFGLPEQVKIEALRNHGITPTVVIKTNVYRNVISPISRAFWSWLNGKSFIVDSMDIDYEYEQVGADLVEVKQPSTTALSIERVNNTRNYYRTRDIIFNGHIARRIPVTLAAPTPATSTVVVMNSNVHVLTDDESVGSSRLNVDWATGQIRLTVPSTGGISASRNSGGLITITTD